MFADAGDIILTATESVLEFPEYIRSTQIYKAYEMDKVAFNN